MQIIKRLYHYRDLLAVFIWREYTVRYRYSVVGVLWAVIQPLSMMLLFTLVFSYVLKVRLSEYPYAVFFFSGLLPWTFFSSSLNYAIPSLTNYYTLITKIYFPREILPISGIAVAVFDHAISLVLFAFLLWFYHVRVTAITLWYIPLFVLLFFFTLAVCLVLASLNVYYRDVKLATAFLIQLWFFASPVMYSIDKLSIKVKFILFLNPLSFIVESMRRCLLENRPVVVWQFALVSAIIAIFFFLAYRFFVRTERAFADVI
jgi:lipopolysaccharide transport system permease protein